jgi:penicillin-binding protein 1A
MDKIRTTPAREGEEVIAFGPGFEGVRAVVETASRVGAADTVTTNAAGHRIVLAPVFEPLSAEQRERIGRQHVAWCEKPDETTRAAWARDDDAKRKADDDAKRKADDDAKRKADEDAKRKADEDAKRKADDDAKRKADDDAKRSESKAGGSAAKKE